MSDFLRNRYLPNGEIDGYRMAADALPVARAVSGIIFAKKLPSPENRTWNHAKTLAAILSTDSVDGFLARRSLGGPDKIGGWIDQLVGDKLTMLSLMRKLDRNDELPAGVMAITTVREVGITGVRMALNGRISTDARDLGKWKFGLQASGAIAASSPLAHETPELHRSLFAASAGLAVVSMGEFTVAAARSVIEEHKPNYGNEHPAGKILSVADTILEQVEDYDNSSIGML